MSDPDLIGLFVEPLERIGVRYMVTGGVASVIYGEPRFTRDIDIVLTLSTVESDRLTAVFSGGDFYLPPEESLREEIDRSDGGHFNLIHRETSLRADVYLAGTDRLHAWAFTHRRRIEIGNQPVWVAPIEYVIARKLQYYEASGSDRHLRDVSMMLAVSRDLVDVRELDRWVGELGLAGGLEAARAFRVE